MPTSADQRAAADAGAGAGAGQGHGRRPGLAGTVDAPTPAPYAAILAVDIAGPGVLVRPADFSPSLSAAAVAERSAAWPHAGASVGIAGYAATPWNPGLDAVAAACADGSPGAACVAPFDDGAHPLSFETGVPVGNPYEHSWVYLTLSPVCVIIIF